MTFWRYGESSNLWWVNIWCDIFKRRVLCCWSYMFIYEFPRASAILFVLEFAALRSRPVDRFFYACCIKKFFSSVKKIETEVHAALGSWKKFK
jgi:hypothetical protein